MVRLMTHWVDIQNSFISSIIELTRGGYMKKLCKDCIYFSKEDDIYARCRRFPPTFRHGIKYIYPLIPIDMPACGEFKPVKKED